MGGKDWKEMTASLYARLEPRRLGPKGRGKKRGKPWGWKKKVRDKKKSLKRLTNISVTGKKKGKELPRNM